MGKFYGDNVHKEDEQAIQAQREAKIVEAEHNDLDFTCEQKYGTLRIYLLVEVPPTCSEGMGKVMIKSISIYKMDYVSKEVARKFVKEFRDKNYSLSGFNARWQADAVPL